MPLSTSVSHDPGSPHARVTLEGSLDTATAPDLEAELDKLLTAPIRVVAFNMAGVTFISSAGIRVLMKTRQTVTDRGGSVVLNNLQPQIVKVLEIVKALPGVSIFRDEREMDEYLAAMQRKVLEGGK